MRRPEPVYLGIRAADPAPRWQLIRRFGAYDFASCIGLLRQFRGDDRQTRYQLSVALDMVGARVSFLIRQLKQYGWPIKGTMRNGYYCVMSEAQGEWLRAAARTGDGYRPCSTSGGPSATGPSMDADV